MMHHRAHAAAQHEEYYASLTPRQKVGYHLWAVFGCLTVALLLATLFLNLVMGCDRSQPDNCFIINQLWEIGL